MAYDDSYYIEAAKNVHISPRPTPVARGGWWFRKWRVTAPSLDGMEDFVIPTPVREVAIAASVVAVKPGEIIVELGEPRKEMSEDAITYASIIMNELRCRLGAETAVEGDLRHTLFLLVKWDCDRPRPSD
ncbi:hypothetical protein [Actinoplanes sp. NPDC026670]|uniref:hypothetical protein n=1 Tax=Actinoplanes sp. NPDC026670 TaxID=3154700 RepID=UPI0033D9EAE0